MSDEYIPQDLVTIFLRGSAIYPKPIGPQESGHSHGIFFTSIKKSLGLWAQKCSYVPGLPFSPWVRYHKHPAFGKNYSLRNHIKWWEQRRTGPGQNSEEQPLPWQGDQQGNLPDATGRRYSCSCWKKRGKGILGKTFHCCVCHEFWPGRKEVSGHPWDGESPSSPWWHLQSSRRCPSGHFLERLNLGRKTQPECMVF